MTRASFELEVDGRRRTITLPKGSRTSVADVLRREGLPLNTRCGGKGRCSGCMIEVIEGRVEHVTTGEVHGPGLVRACEQAATGAALIRVPPRSHLALRPQILSDFRLNVPAGCDPLWQDGRLGGALGAAIDVGTTTVVVALVELETGRIVSRAAAMNRQAELGEDVVTRINLCSSDPGALSRLQDAIVRRTIVPLLHEALSTADARSDRLKCCAVVGNTTMLHLLAGVDPSPIGVAPFTPSFLEHRVLDRRQLRHWPTALDVPLHLLPGAAAYIGADLTAGSIATGLWYDDGPSLLVDAGTNGEIILKHGDRILGCATAAGPAFEGAGLTCGMRAGAGAVEHLSISPDTLDIACGVIDGRAPTGICGSGYVDFLAEARRTRLLTAAGRLTERTNGMLRSDQCGGRAIVVATHDDDEVRVSEADVAMLLAAKAAIAAGILTLLDSAGLTPRHIGTVHLAGGFGTHVNVASAIACGLLPGFEPSQVVPAGNSALAGACLALLDRGSIAEMHDVGRALEVVELNLDPRFEDRYIDQLPLP